MNKEKSSGNSGSSGTDRENNLLKSKALDALLSAISLIDTDGKIIYVNQAFCELWGIEKPENVVDQPLEEFINQENGLEKVIADALDQGKWKGELELHRSDGSSLEVSISANTIRESGEHRAQLITFTDITEIKDKTRTIQRQAEQLIESSTPIIEVWEGVLTAPLIGNLDTERTQKFMERLLENIVDLKAEVALIDITGVPDVDTRTAQHLIETVESVRLLGARVVLTGVSPSIAQSIVHLGIDLSGITTKTTLAEGLKHVFERETPWEMED